jgi:hypothetical protein
MGHQLAKKHISRTLTFKKIDYLVSLKRLWGNLIIFVLKDIAVKRKLPEGDFIDSWCSGAEFARIKDVQLISIGIRVKLCSATYTVS